MHGEEKHLIVAQRDQVQLFEKQIAHLLRHTAGVTLRRAGPGELGQALGRCEARWHSLQRIVVADFFQLEVATLRHLQRGGQQIRRKQASQPQAWTQAPLGIGLQRKAALRHSETQAHCGHHVLQRLARARVHVDITAGHQPQTVACARAAQRSQP